MGHNRKGGSGNSPENSKKSTPPQRKNCPQNEANPKKDTQTTEDVVSDSDRVVEIVDDKREAEEMNVKETPATIKEEEKNLFVEVSNLKASVEEIKQFLINLNQPRPEKSTTQKPGVSPICHPMQSPGVFTPQHSPKCVFSPKTLECLMRSEPCLKGSGQHKSSYQKKSVFSEMSKGLGRKRLFAEMLEGAPVESYMDHDPLHTSNEIGRTIGIDLPEWVPVLFRPPRYMILDEVQVTVAAYIFATNKADAEHGKEILIITDSKSSADRKTLQTLMPNQLLDQEVLNMMVSLLSHEERLIGKYSSCWFLPTHFAHYAFRKEDNGKTVMGYYKKDFMGHVENLVKIFVPVNDHISKHWFLLVVDIEKEKMILLDSKPCVERMRWRRRSVRKLGTYLEEMLEDVSFYNLKKTAKPAISDYPVVSPANIGEQLPGTTDCGIFVSQWMRECNLTDDYHTIQADIGDATRMRIALDLVLKPYNKLRDTVIQKAFQYMKNLEEKRKKLVDN